MLPKKPTNYDKPVCCCKCGYETDTVYINYNEQSVPYCEKCYEECTANEDEDFINENWYSMDRYEYLDEENERAYDEYADRLIDEFRDEALI